jgi:hypothetical protein
MHGQNGHSFPKKPAVFLPNQAKVYLNREGNLTTWKTSEGTDRVDHFLLELIIGLELRAIGEHTELCAVSPILIGPQRQDSSFTEFPFGKLGMLSREPSAMTNNRGCLVPRQSGSWRPADQGDAGTLGETACGSPSMPASP